MLPLSVCVFCGSSASVAPVFFDVARKVGERLARRGLRLVYGGASVGLMGATADAALACGGQVVGVIPTSIEAREIAHRGLTRLHVVDTMHQRKQLMFDESHAFLALPGGFGTLDELFEMATWRQIGVHEKPIAVLDVDGYFQPLFAWIDAAVDARFVPTDVASAMERLSNLDQLERWLDRSLPR